MRFFVCAFWLWSLQGSQFGDISCPQPRGQDAWLGSGDLPQPRGSRSEDGQWWRGSNPTSPERQAGELAASYSPDRSGKARPAPPPGKPVGRGVGTKSPRKTVLRDPVLLQPAPAPWVCGGRSAGSETPLVLSQSWPLTPPVSRAIQLHPGRLLRAQVGGGTGRWPLGAAEPFCHPSLCRIPPCQRAEKPWRDTPA